MEVISNIKIQVPEEINLTQFILNNCRKYKTRPALINAWESRLLAYLKNRRQDIDALTDERISYAEFVDEVCRCSSALLELGVRQGDKICLFSQNSVQYPIIYLSIINIQAVCVPVNHTSTSCELGHYLEDSDSSILVLSSSNIPILEELLSSPEANTARNLKAVVVLDSVKTSSDLYTTYKDFISRAEPQGPHRNETREGLGGPIPSRTVATICYSSGTTGKPKGCEQSHYSYIANIVMLEAARIVDDGEVTVAALPMFHMFGQLVYLTHALYAGLTMVVCDRFTPQTFLTLVHKYRATLLHVVPPILAAITTLVEQQNLQKQTQQRNTYSSMNRVSATSYTSSQPATDSIQMKNISAQTHIENFESVSASHMRSVRTIISAASSLSTSVNQRFKNWFPWIDVLQGYGMTECMFISLMKPSDKQPGTCGRLMPNVTAKVIDPDTGRCLGVGEEGEVLVLSPCLMSRYLNNEQATRDSFDSLHYLRTGLPLLGDLGYYDKDGLFYLVGRVKEQIKYKGHQISPLELECVLLRHPAVTDAAVIGIPDEICGDLPRAFVVLHKSDLEVRPTVSQLINFLHDRVSPHKYLRGGLEITDSIPRTSSGKILRRVILAQALSNKTISSKL